MKKAFCVVFVTQDFTLDINASFDYTSKKKFLNGFKERFNPKVILSVTRIKVSKKKLKLINELLNLQNN